MKFLLVSILLLGQLAVAAPKSLKMYSEPNARPNPNCDVHTEMTLWEKAPEATVMTVSLRDSLDGACEIYVLPNPRTYIMTREQDSCGSKVYVDTMAGARLMDHRTRMCEDIVPALFVLEETDAEGKVRTLYSKDQ